MALTHRYGALTMADNPNPDHLRGWGAPIPDRLTPEERAAVESIRGDWQDARVAAMRAALDRLAPKPDPGPEREAREAASRFIAGRWVYVSPEQPSGFCAVPPHWVFQPSSSPEETLAALRAHGFRHQSEMNNGHEPPAPPPAAVDVVREALNFCGYAGTGAAALTAALAARGVTFPTGA